MRFRDFIQSEEQSSNDKGLMGFGTPMAGRKPSDGQPFAKFLSSVAGSGQSQNAGAAGPMFMKKKMKKA